MEARLPNAIRRVIRRAVGEAPPVGGVAFGDLRRTEPIDPYFGYERGTPVDRYYIERFLRRWQADVAGHVLEIGDNDYTVAIGGDRVTRSSILHVSADNPRATHVADLADADHLQSAEFDCIIFTQTLQMIYDTDTALRTLRRILKPGGVLLVTAPGISQIDRGEWGSSWYWFFTPISIQRMFANVFGAAPEIEVYGNVLSATALLHGLAMEELKPQELDVYDPAYPVTIGVRATRNATAS